MAAEKADTASAGDKKERWQFVEPTTEEVIYLLEDPRYPIPECDAVLAIAFITLSIDGVPCRSLDELNSPKFEGAELDYVDALCLSHSGQLDNLAKAKREQKLVVKRGLPNDCQYVSPDYSRGSVVSILTYEYWLRLKAQEAAGASK